MNTIGETLKNIRLSLGFIQSQVCKNIMSQSNYSKVEKGEIDISFSKMVELLNRLDMSVDEFMYIKNDYKKHAHSQMSKLKNLKFNDTELIAEYKHRLDRKEKLTTRELEIVAIYDALILIGEKNDFKAAKEKIKPIWERLEKYDNWYLYDIQIINNIIYLFPVNTAVSIGQLAVNQLEKYKEMRGVNNLSISIQMNLLLLLIENGQYEAALDEVDRLIPSCISKNLTMHLAVCYVRKGLLMELLSQTGSEEWYDNGYKLLEIMQNDKLKKELQKEVSQYKK
ncbi:helix-turn-helix domain-containing protein [Alkalibacterium sp. 20]|uniref:helix-turn-helix domain-containing protein n=1 Tax=Alkalibacterium sp. 20 TaxID=1798803 RepID=UPI000900387C|nr:Rgg/GadR/MutR family transcriptional regulator [Alkalibacterium sp. 20]OJF92144.1 hypothetical protein AX762_02780 [Alkalibacterium sp. 20]